MGDGGASRGAPIPNVTPLLDSFRQRLCVIPITFYHIRLITKDTDYVTVIVATLAGP